MISKSQLIYRGSRMRSTLIAVAALAILAGCSTYDSVTQRIAQSITPYRITVVQGNFVSKEAASQMQVGMSRAQVRQLLGTPLLADMFHADRWDYVFYFKRGSTNVVQQRDFIVLFAGDRVASWSGGEDLPSNLELLAEIDGDKRGKKAAVPNVASSAAGASAPVAAAAPVTVDTTRSPSVEGAAAAAAPSTDANAEAAQAANRATNAVQAPSRNTRSSVRSTAPTANAGGVPPQGATSAGQPQFQFHRPPPPAPSSQDNPVGPSGSSQSGSSPTYNAPLTAPSTSGTSQ